jgi:hypothetical protein|tara:strand:- start:1829 stop:2140 length:312 start_codon:yes stop_codon:yes gene_type:complete
MIKIKNKKYLFLTISFFVLFGCTPEAEERPQRVNCGEIVRMWSQHSSSQEGNPCADNTSSRRFAFIVRNDITGNEKHFCINISEYVSYNLGSIYCDSTNLDGW